MLYDMSLTYGRHIVHRVTDCFICAALGAKHKDSIHAAIPENTGIDLTIASVGSGSINTFFSIPDYKKADSGTSARYGNGPYHPVTVSAGSGSINLEKQ